MKEQLKSLMITGGITRNEYEQMMDDNLVADALTIRAVCLGFIIYFSLLAIVGGMKYGMGFVYHDVGIVVGYLLIFFFHKAKRGANNVLAFEVIMGLCIIYGLVAAFYAQKFGESSFALVGCIMLIILTCPFRPVMGSVIVLSGVILYVLEGIIIRPAFSLTSDMVNTIAFGTATCFIQANINGIRIKAYRVNKQNRIQAHMDSLTGLNNRMDFSLRIGEYSAGDKPLPTCIYVDVNGLHELNNRLGHAAGDEMLMCVGNSLCTLFGKESTFRIGGDEFVILTALSDEKYLNEKIAVLRNELEEKNYYISVGYALPGNGEKAIDMLVQAAEMAMYADKAEYYRKNHIERRTTRA